MSMIFCKQIFNIQTKTKKAEGHSQQKWSSYICGMSTLFWVSQVDCYVKIIACLANAFKKIPLEF